MRWRNALAFVLLGVASAVQSQDLSMTVTTDPPAPWSAATPVILTLTITNHAAAPRRASIDLEGIDQFHGLVRRLDVRNTDAVTYAHPSCVDFSPPLQDLMWCLTSIPIDPGQSLIIEFDVIAFPDAFGFRHAIWTAYPESSNFGAVPGGELFAAADLLFAYGVIPHRPVPTLVAFSEIALFCLLVLSGLVVLRRYDALSGETQ